MQKSLNLITEILLDYLEWLKDYSPRGEESIDYESIRIYLPNTFLLLKEFRIIDALENRLVDYPNNKIGEVLGYMFKWQESEVHQFNKYKGSFTHQSKHDPITLKGKERFEKIMEELKIEPTILPNIFKRLLG